MIVRAESIFFPGRGFVKGMSLFIRDGIVEKIVDAGNIDRDAPVMDFPGLVVAPLFCDYHLHFSKERLSDAGSSASLLLKSGITRVYEGGDRDLSGVGMKKVLGERLDIRTAGYALYKKGSYGKFIGIGVSDLDEARESTDRLRSLGVDYMKLITSGIFMPESGEISGGGFEGPEIREIIAYATDKGLPVICHANGDKAVRVSAEAGAWAIVHGFSASDETLSVMAEKRVALIPTANALLSLTTVSRDREAIKRVEKFADAHLATMARAREKGVSVLPGSDAGPAFIPYGTSYLKELDLFQRAGFSDEEILSSAVVGPIEEGARADFLVLNGLFVEKVFFDGALVTDSSLTYPDAVKS